MTSKDFPKVGFFSKNPAAAAISTKMIKNRFNYNGDASQSLTSLQSISQSTTQSINDAENIFEVLPDTELAMQILVSSILSPNDMRRPELNWSVEKCELPSPLTGAMIEIIRTYFEDDYRIKAELPKWLEQALFYSGSYPIAIVPESSLDDLINNRNISTESLKDHLDSNHICKNIGLLGNATKRTGVEQRSSGLESLLKASGENSATYVSNMEKDKNIFVTDHYGVLKIPEVVKRITESKVNETISMRTRSNICASLESLHNQDPEKTKMSLYDVEKMLYGDRNETMQQIVKLKPGNQASRASIGHPLTLRLPSDSVIPVHVPSDPEKHIGYFILLDELGNPLSNAKQSSYYKEISALRAAGNNAASNTLQQVKTLTKGMNCPDNVSYRQMSQIYSKAVEDDLLERLRNGIYGENVEISHVDDIYQIMMSRSLASKRTQVLFIPASLLLYVAFDYNKLGVGRSLLDKSKTLASIRAILLFSNTMAAIKNSTNQRKINIELDPDDPEPDRTIEILLTEIAKTQSMAFPLATTHPMDIVDGIRNAATNVSIKGNPNMPEVAVDIEDRAGSRVMVDTELDELMKNRHLMALGLTPELVDSSTDIEFAAEIINRNLMFTKRLATSQEITENFIIDFVTKFTLNSGKLQLDLIKTIQEFLADAAKQEKSSVTDAREQKILRERNPTITTDMTVSEMVSHFLECLSVTLPKPDDTKLDNQMELMTNYSTALDTVIPFYINQEALEVMLGDEASTFVEPVVQMVKGYYMRDFIAKNNILPELQNLIAKPNIEEEPIDILESHLSHSNGLAVVIKNLLTRFKDKNAPAEETETPAEDTEAVEDPAVDAEDIDFDVPE